MLGDSLGIYDGTEIGSFNGAFDGSNDGNLDGSISLVGSPVEAVVPSSKSGAGVGNDNDVGLSDGSGTLLGTDDGCPGLGLLDENVVGCPVARSQYSHLS